MKFVSITLIIIELMVELLYKNLLTVSAFSALLGGILGLCSDTEWYRAAALKIKYITDFYPSGWWPKHIPIFNMESYSIYFQDPESPVMEGLICFHDQVMFLVSFIVLFVGTALYSCVSTFKKRRFGSLSARRPERFIHCTVIEIAWTTLPALCLLNLAVPSFALLYAMEELPAAQGYLKCVGHQWYWTYEYADYHFPVKTPHDCSLKPAIMTKDAHMTMLESRCAELLAVEKKVISSELLDDILKKVISMPESDQVAELLDRKQKSMWFNGHCPQLIFDEKLFWYLGVADDLDYAKTLANFSKRLYASSTPPERDDCITPIHLAPKLGRDSIKVESYLIDEFVGEEYKRLLSVDNTAKIPAKEHIRLLITSADVLHSWAIPSLGIKVDACPGRMNQSTVYLNSRKTKHYGQCSELCGVNHGFMPVVLQAF